jgi:pimeloyl-ACP methyl ester carboxylesterase
MGFPELLEKKIISAKAFCLDLPGTGENNSEISPANIKGITDFLRSRWLLHPAKPTTIVAVSLGGMVALDWLARYPQDFSGGVIINSSAQNLSPPWQRMRWQNWWRLLLLPFLPTKVLEKTILQLTVNNPTKRITLLDLWHKWNLERPISLLNIFNQLIAAATFRTPNIQKPLLFLTSAQDNQVNPECSKNLAAHYKAPLALHLTASHDLSLDDPDWTIAEIKKWLK